MELLVSASGLDLSPQTIRTLSQRIDLAVDRLEAVIETIDVQINGRLEMRPQDTPPLEQRLVLSCRIQVSLSENEPIDLVEMDGNLSELIERITERLGVIVSKRADDRRSTVLARQKRYSHLHRELPPNNIDNASSLG